MDLNVGSEVIFEVQGWFIKKIGVMLGKSGQDMAKRDETVEDASGFRAKGTHEVEGAVDGAMAVGDTKVIGGS